jgi:hypothetical protein
MIRLAARALIPLAGLALAVMPLTPVAATAVRDQGRTDSVAGHGAGRRVLLVTTDTGVRAPATVRAGTSPLSSSTVATRCTSDPWCA